MPNERLELTPEILREASDNDLRFAMLAIQKEMSERNLAPADHNYARRGYAANFEQAHSQTSLLVDKQIETGVLPEEYALPAIEEFDEQFIALKPFYQRMHRRKHWQPEVVLVPYGISREMWDTLLTGHQMEEGQERGLARAKLLEGAVGEYQGKNPDLERRKYEPSEGIDYMPERLGREAPSIPESRLANGKLWEVAVTHTGWEGILSGLSLDGAKGERSKARLALTTLIGGPSKSPDDMPELTELIRMASPSHAVYYAMQLANLAAGRGLIGHSFFIAGKERMQYNGKEMALIHSTRLYPPRISTFPSYVADDWQRLRKYLALQPTITGSEAIAYQDAF